MPSPELATRTDHTARLYDAAYGEIIAGAQRIADIGAGDSDFALKARLAGKDVVRIDAQYAQKPPIGGNYIAADARDLSEIPDASFDACVSTFMMQHFAAGNGDVKRAILEMVRIIEPSHDPADSKGIVGIFPVWKEEELKEVINLRFSDIAQIGYPNQLALEKFKKYPRKFPTLAIKISDSTSLERVEELAEVIDETCALNKRRTPVDLGITAVSRLTGNTQRHVA